MEKQLFSALAQSSAGIALFDQEARVLFANSAWERLITGISEDELHFIETPLENGGLISICIRKPVETLPSLHDLGNLADINDLPATTLPGTLAAANPDAHTPVLATISAHGMPAEGTSSTAPIAPAARSMATSLPVNMPGGNVPQGTILIVDDSPSNRMVARRILQAEGYAIVEAGNGQSVINMLRRGVSADLILMDVEMPEMDGLHATRHIRRMSGPVARTPIIALSAHQSRDWNLIARESGVDDFIDKPINRAHLLDTVRDLITASPLRNTARKSSPPPILRANAIAALQAGRNDGTTNAQSGRPGLPERPVLDFDILAQLYLDAGDEGASCGIDLFIDETESRLQRIETALSNDDLATVRDEVHVLKSTSGTFGLRQLSELCENTQAVFDHETINESHIMTLSRQVLRLAPAALTTLDIYRQSREPLLRAMP